MVAPKARGSLACALILCALLLPGAPAFAGGSAGSGSAAGASGDIPPGPTGPVSGPTSTDSPANPPTTITAPPIQQGQSFSDNAVNAADGAQRLAANGVLLTLKGLNLLDAKHPNGNAGVMLEQGAEALQTADDLAKYAVQNDDLAKTLQAGDSPAAAAGAAGSGSGAVGGAGSGSDLVPDSTILGSSSAKDVFKTFEGKYGVDSKDMVKEITATKANPVDLEKTLSLPKGSIESAIAAANTGNGQAAAAGIDAETAAMIASLKKDAAKVLGNAQDATGTLVGAGAPDPLSAIVAPERTTASQAKGAGEVSVLPDAGGLRVAATPGSPRLWSDAEFASPDTSLFARVSKKYRERQRPLLLRK